MKTLLTIAAVALIAMAAAAQYKTPPSPQVPVTTNPGNGVQVQPNPNVVITPGAVPDDELSTARRIPRDEATKMVKQGKAVYVDVRSKETYDESHIPGAISIPLSELVSRIKELPPHKFIITYCA